jgi:FKBP-type peptidyl-prolyl cis-trans isomerase FklB
MMLNSAVGFSMVRAMNMKVIHGTILACLLAANGLRAEDAKPFKDDKEKVNYAIGMSVGNNFKQANFEYDEAAFNRGMLDALANKPGLTMPEAQETIKKYQQERRAILGEKNKAQGATFLAENKAKPGIVTLTNGLQYKIITDGSGEIPKPEDTVSVNYRGTFIDGTEFDSSAKTGKPATFRVGGVIKGWTEALTRMKTGAKWQLFIPYDLAYGEMGRPPNIPPAATLLFDVELLSIQPPTPPTPPAAPLTSDIIKVPSLEEMKKGAKIETIKADEIDKLQKPAAAQSEKK